VINESVKKTDKHDAATIAEFLSKDMLPESKLCSETSEQLKAALESAEHLGTGACDGEKPDTRIVGVHGDGRHESEPAKQARAPENSGHPRRSGKRTRSPTAV